MSVVNDLTIIQLFVVCIFESKEMDNETAGVGIDITIIRAGTSH